MNYVTAGESHGNKLTVIIEGIPAGVKIDINAINDDLRRRQSGYGRGGRQKIETDKALFTSGVRFGKTLGTPICIDIYNKDFENWEEIMSPFGAPPKDFVREVTPRPGHADLVGYMKTNVDDCRDILERASARETAARVAAGAVAKEFLAQLNVEVFSFVTSIGKIKLINCPINYIDDNVPYDLIKDVEMSALRCPDAQTTNSMMEEIDFAAKKGNTLGGTFRVMAYGIIPGLGSYASAKARLTSQLAAAIYSIPAIKGLEFGIGFDYANNYGSDVHDEIILENSRFWRKTNNAGGLEGGMTNGLPLWLSAAMKPIPTCMNPLQTVNLDTLLPQDSFKERSDVCAVPAASVVAEAEVAFVLANAYIEMFGNSCMADLIANCENYKKRISVLCK